MVTFENFQHDSKFEVKPLQFGMKMFLFKLKDFTLDTNFYDAAKRLFTQRLSEYFCKPHRSPDCGQVKDPFGKTAEKKEDEKKKTAFCENVNFAWDISSFFRQYFYINEVYIVDSF